MGQNKEVMEEKFSRRALFNKTADVFIAKDEEDINRSVGNMMLAIGITFLTTGTAVGLIEAGRGNSNDPHSLREASVGLMIYGLFLTSLSEKIKRLPGDAVPQLINTVNNRLSHLKEASHAASVPAEPSPLESHQPDQRS